MITVATIKKMASNPNFLGWGYLGAGERDDETDEMLAEAANELGLAEDEVFLWANSRNGRKFMDPEKPSSSAQFITELRSSLPELRRMARDEE